MKPSIIFVAGIFAGWIIEWLFYMLIVRRKNKKLEALAKAKAAEAKAAEAKAAEAKAAEAKAAEAKAAEAKAAEAKAAEAKAAEAKAAEAKEVKATETVQSSESEEAPTFDDLSKLKGVGPKIAESLMEVNVTSYSQLAEMSGDDIVEKLELAEVKIVNRAKLDDLQAQAKLAAAGKWDELETLKQTL
ncbi:MAG: Unknown protein [uncultured Thiotrichaceae bacterium]|uniref:LSU ribosomal protein L21p n=1 Tax=uncultured Thiotrichaceae bacterium TaxID=298394 RepID=A0A6S6TR66_9GAMM|nr:MAG: Unknown protein [uncultured Thiotrichaceae bacterium]